MERTYQLNNLENGTQPKFRSPQCKADTPSQILYCGFTYYHIWAQNHSHLQKLPNEGITEIYTFRGRARDEKYL